MALDYKTATVSDIPTEWPDEAKGLATAAIEARDSTAKHIGRLNKESEGHRHRADQVEEKLNAILLDPETGKPVPYDEFKESLKWSGEDGAEGSGKSPQDIEKMFAARLDREVSPLKKRLDEADAKVLQKEQAIRDRDRDAAIAAAVNEVGTTGRIGQVAQEWIRSKVRFDEDGKTLLIPVTDDAGEHMEPFSAKALKAILPQEFLPPAGGSGSGGKPTAPTRGIAGIDMARVTRGDANYINSLTPAQKSELARGAGLQS